MKEVRKPSAKVTVVEDSAISQVELKKTRQTDSTVLVLDDNPGTLRRLCKALDNGRRRIVAVREAGSAVDLLFGSGMSFDILVSDYNIRLGNPTGFKGDFVCEVAKKANPAIKTIIISGDPGDARKASVDKLLQKDPSQPDETMRILKHAVERLESELKSRRR
jgi:CheY-like chemotaxis protein